MIPQTSRIAAVLKGAFGFVTANRDPVTGGVGIYGDGQTNDKILNRPVAVPAAVIGWNPGAATGTTYTIQAGAGGPNGKYYYYVTGAVGTGAQGVAGETACSPAEPANPIVTGGEVKSITLLNVPVFDDARVTRRFIYRSKDATADTNDLLAKAPQLVGMLNDNVTTIFVDSVPDSGLGGFAPFVDTTAPMFTYKGAFVGNIGGTAQFIGIGGPTAWNLGYYNCGYGPNALSAIAGGVRNVALGGDALQFLTTGSGNTAVGIHAGAGNRTGGSNISIGYMAAQIPGNNGSGNCNIAIGNSALTNEASGSQNVAVGYQASLNQNGVSNNVSVGYKAGANVTTGVTNIFIGSNAGGTSGVPALTGNGNTAVGYNAGQKLTGIGSHNVLVGSGAAGALTSGYYHVIIGDTAGAALTTQTGNVIIGNNAGRYTADSNAFFIDNQDRTNSANEKSKSLMYGVFDAAPANQRLAINGLVKHQGYTVATLPSASAALQGYRGYVTDANATLTAGIGAVVVGGGANVVPVFCDGTNWRIG